MTGPRLGARIWWGVIPLLLLLWGAGALAVSTLPGLPATPLLTLALVPGVGFARTVAVALAVGVLAVRLLVAAPEARRWAVGWSITAAALAVVSLAGLVAEATPGSGDEAIGQVVGQSLAGRALLLQALGMLAAAVLVLVTARRTVGIVAVTLAGLAAAAPAAAGHAGLSGPHAPVAVSIGLHVIAVSMWVGGLAAVVALVIRSPERASALLPRYSVLALICVIVLAETGLLTASLTAGTVLDLLGTTYGSIVLAKAALLAWLVLLGWQQRRRAVDRLPAASVPRTVAAIAAVEFVLMGTAMAAATVLARTGPSPLPGSGFAPLTLVVLGLAVPMVVVAVRPRGWRVTDGLPEVTAVVLLIVIVEVGGVGLLRAALGSLGVSLEVLLLVVAGWLAMAASRTGGWGVGILAAGIPIALGAATVLANRLDGPRMAIVAVLAAEVLLLVWWRRLRSGDPGSAAEDEVLAGSVS